MPRRVLLNIIFLSTFGVFLFSKELAAQKEPFYEQLDAAKAAEKDGRFVEAEQKYKTALSLAERFKRSDPRLFYAQSGLASFYEARDRTGEAEDSYRKALASLVYLSEHSDDPAIRPNRYLLLCIHQERMGDFYFAQKKFSDAEDYYQQSLASAGLASKNRVKPRSNDEWLGSLLGALAQGKSGIMDTARLNEKLALICSAEGKVQEAETLDRKAAQERRKRPLGTYDPDEREKSEEAVAALRAKNYAQGISIYQEVLKEAERRHGPGDPRVASILNDLGVAFTLAGNYPEAEDSFQRSLRVYEHARGAASPESAPTLKNYSGMLRRAGRNAEADQMAARARALRPSEPPPH